MTQLIFLNWVVLAVNVASRYYRGVPFLLLNFTLKHMIVGTHIRNNPLHCSQLLSELLLFELNFVNIGLCLFSCAI